MTSHVYNKRNNPVATIVGNVSSEVISETANLILSLEMKLLILRFDCLDKEILSLKDVIIKNLQVENQRHRNKVSEL